MIFIKKSAVTAGFLHNGKKFVFLPITGVNALQVAAKCVKINNIYFFIGEEEHRRCSVRR